MKRRLEWLLASCAVASSAAAVAAAYTVIRGRADFATRLLSLEGLASRASRDGVALERLTGRVEALEHLEQERQQQDREDGLG